MKNNLTISRILLLVSAVILSGALFLPIWRIELDAPQYPEGLVLEIYANGIRGDVDIINGLNHYIGMATIHNEDFMEFKILPYLIGLLVMLGIIVAIINKKEAYYWYFVLFMFIAIISMIDFYAWEYNYGHNLNPHAAIQVPGMSYQPPLIGFKQLLNFGAYSIPDSGGWLFIISGLLSFTVFLLVLQPRWLGFSSSRNKICATVVSGILMIFLISCTPGPQPINYSGDGCEFCKMTIMDKRFACELVNKNGKAYKFDDIFCLLKYLAKSPIDDHNIYVSAFNTSNGALNNITVLSFVKDEALGSPMGGNIAAFNNNKSALTYAASRNLNVLTWSNIVAASSR